MNISVEEISIEPLTAELCSLYEDELATFYLKNMKLCTSIGDYDFLDAKRKIGELKDYIAMDKAIVYGAFYQNVLVGYIWSYVHKFRQEERLYVSEIHVDDNWRSRNIGKRLLARVEDDAVNLGLGTMYIHVEAKNSGALKLYEREGYEVERIQLRKIIDN